MRALRAFLCAMTIVASSSLHAQSPQPDGAGVSRGALPARWSPTDSSCAAQAPFTAHEYDATTLIIRQSRCTNYEKPFLYLLIGEREALLMDTGAKGADAAAFVRETLRSWAARAGRAVPRLVVAHSHGHGDHTASDSLFARLPSARLIKADPDSLRLAFHIARWPEDVGTYDLGGRQLQIVPIPGHERASIAVYDARTGLLLTGDTMYPGRLYVRDGAAFRASIDRLVDFTRGKIITHVLGAHIEQQRTPYLDYVVGTSFQPDEHALELSRGQLLELQEALRAMPDSIERRAFRDFTVWPVK